MATSNQQGQRARLDELLARAAGGRVVFLTGAGVSAASGIPTFRGQEGYWTVGSREYHPQEMATLEAFGTMRRECWRWYLYRRGICNAAEPNPAHAALVRAERALGERFRLITQNVDGLHRRAGNTGARTYEVHGQCNRMRAMVEGAKPIPIPDGVGPIAKDEPLTDEVYALLCDDEGRPTRPHILWFDEYYDERLYRSDSAMRAASECDLFVVVGTSGAAAIPVHATAAAANNGAGIINIDPHGDNPFAVFARERGPERGLWLGGGAVEWLPELVERIVAG